MTDPTTTEATAGLAERVRKFNLMQLPGQPFGMHMGTSYLVNDLAAEVLRLSATVADLTAANIALAAECARLKARDVDATTVINRLVALNDDSGPFGGEMWHDRVERAWSAARAYLAGGAE